MLINRYLFISIITFIFTNLGERKPWQLSAYSVFNPNFERLPGTLSVNDLQSSIGMGERNDDIDETEDSVEIRNNYSQSLTNNTSRTLYDTKSEIRKRELKSNAKQSLNALCHCGSRKKYKNCCIKIVE